MKTYNEKTDSKTKIILAAPFIPIAILYLLIILDFCNIPINTELISNINDTLFVIYCVLGYGFYLAYWSLKEGKDITKNDMKHLMENNVLFLEVINLIKNINRDSNIPDNLKEDLISAYFNIANKILDSNERTLSYYTGYMFDRNFDCYITEQDKETYDRIMKYNCVTPKEYINTKHWELIEKAIILGIHYNTYDDNLLSKHCR